MEIADEPSHRVLAYLVGINRAGYRPTVEELGAYAEKPDRIRWGPTWAAKIAQTLAQQLAAKGPLEVESVIDYFERLGWANVSQGRIACTALGEAVLRTLDQAQPDEAVIEAVLTPEDPLAYSRLIARIAMAGNAMIVDPYFRLDHLLPIATNTSVTKILTSDKIDAGDRAGLADGVPRLALSRSLEVRLAPGEEMHDRFIIPRSGPVQMLGLSLSGVGRRATIVTELHDTAEEVRSRYEGIWTNAKSLAVAGASDEASTDQT